MNIRFQSNNFSNFDGRKTHSMRAHVFVNFIQFMNGVMITLRNSPFYVPLSEVSKVAALRVG